MIPKAPKDEGINLDDMTNLSIVKLKIWENHVLQPERDLNKTIDNDVKPEY